MSRFVETSFLNEKDSSTKVGMNKEVKANLLNTVFSERKN